LNWPFEVEKSLPFGLTSKLTMDDPRELVAGGEVQKMTLSSILSIPTTLSSPNLHVARLGSTVAAEEELTVTATSVDPEIGPDAGTIFVTSRLEVNWKDSSSLL